jgi:adenine-specific DNA-methyltransferase
MRGFLSPDGSLWIAIDDNEAHYLKIVCDEVFGRENFITSVIWEKADSPRNSARQFSTDHDYILAFLKKSKLDSQQTAAYRGVKFDIRESG